MTEQSRQQQLPMSPGQSSLLEKSQERSPAERTEVAEIIPFGQAGSVIPGVNPINRVENFLFIGGPLDGKVLAVPLDGRLYVCHSGSFLAEVECRYCPAVIKLSGHSSMVYILEERLVVYRRQGDALGVDPETNDKRLAASGTVRRLTRG